MIGPLPYIGGKRRLAKRLIALIPEHRTYVEPFAGGAQVFFHKPRSAVEVLNDVDDEIVNFLRVVQRHPHELARWLRWQPASRRLFEWYQAPPPSSLTDIERAARFLYLQKNAWSGRVHRQNFHYSVAHTANYSPARLPARLIAAATRLDQVQIEHAPYEAVLRRYDADSSFFMCDPPYVGVNLYHYNFSDQQFIELAAQLATLKGKFLLSVNDCPQAREWFGRFHTRPIALTYTALKRPRLFQELVVTNYPLPDSSP
jgi:DNA adenine methylase